MKSILNRIKDAIDEIEWGDNYSLKVKETLRNKSYELCVSIFSLYERQRGDFYQYKSLSRDFFYKVVSKKYAYIIKDNLLLNNILEVNLVGGKETYNVSSGIGKGYRFNLSLINGYYSIIKGGLLIKSEQEGGLLIENIGQDLNNNFVGGGQFNNKSIYKTNLKSTPSHHCVPHFLTLGNQEFNLEENLSYFKDIKFENVDDFINNFKLTNNDLLINENIKEEYIKVVLDDEKYSYKTETALSLAKNSNKDLILYNEKGYIENVDTFITRKTEELKVLYRKSVFDLETGIIRISRNKTNRRLDTNFTNMKSDLLNYITLDGEKMIELDIANAQFALLSYVGIDLDEDFIERSQNGTLYENNKMEWFRICFDKIKKEQDEYRKRYPKTMTFIDDYKRQYGYKNFSIYLQNVESRIMIDGLLKRLLDLGYKVITIHDAIRVKESEVEKVKEIVESFFNEIGFKCLLRTKQKNKEVESKIVNFKYRGFKEVNIKITKDEYDYSIYIFKTFFKDIDILNEYEWNKIISLEKGWDEYKLWYFYNIIDKKYRIKSST